MIEGNAICAKCRCRECEHRDKKMSSGCYHCDSSVSEGPSLLMCERCQSIHGPRLTPPPAISPTCPSEAITAGAITQSEGERSANKVEAASIIVRGERCPLKLTSDSGHWFWHLDYEGTIYSDMVPYANGFDALRGAEAWAEEWSKPEEPIFDEGEPSPDPAEYLSRARKEAGDVADTGERYGDWVTSTRFLFGDTAAAAIVQAAPGLRELLGRDAQ